MSAAPEPSGIRRVARLSGRTLDDALTAVIAQHGDDVVVDLRADAYGHGASELEARARARGITRFTRDGERTAPTGPGLDIYGFGSGQQPLLTLHGEVVAVKRVAADTAVSYGYTYRTPGESTLALVALGYADGVPRSASNTATVRIGDRRGIIAGRIAMDQLVVDLGDGTASVGDPAVLWDDGETLAAWCAATQRSAASLTARLGPRIRREWSDT